MMQHRGEWAAAPRRNAPWTTAVLSTALVFTAAACAGPVVYDRQAVQRAQTMDVNAVVAPKADRYLARLLERALVRQFRQSGVAAAAIGADSIGGGGVPSPGHHVAFTVDQWRTRSDDTPGGAIAIYALGIFIVPFFFTGLVRKKTHHDMDYRVAVRSLEGAPIVLEETDEGAMPRYDVARVPPHFRGRYSVEMESAVNWFRSEVGNNRGRAQHEEDVTEQMATRMVNASLDDVAQAVRLYRPPPAPSSVPPTPGGPAKLTIAVDGLR